MNLKWFYLSVFFLFNLTPCHALGYKIPTDQEVLNKLTNNDLTLELNPNNFSVLVWNIYKGKKKSWATDFDHLKKADICLLQEFSMTSIMRDVFEFDPIYNYTMATSFISKVETGVANAQKIEPTTEMYIRSPGKEPIILTPKMALYSKYAFEGGGEIGIVNIHSLNFVSRKTFKEQIENILTTVDLDMPFIFAGDFNTNTKLKLKYLNARMDELGFKAVTFSPDNRMRFNGHPLDHIYIKDLQIIKSKNYGEIKGSDHTALEVTLKTN